MNKFFITSHLSENIAETPEGFLICTGVPIARTGEMVYGPGESPIEVGPDGVAIVYRDQKEVFRPETIASFEGKPFTIGHPNDFVNPDNWRVLAKGTIQNVRRGDGEHANDIVADILISDAEAIKLVRGGVREVSCGYECEYVQLGVGRGMQTNIIGNHLALVEQGRAGAAYAINDQKGAKMKTLGEKIRGIFAKAGDEAAKVVDEVGKDTKDAKDKKDGDMPAWAGDIMKKMDAIEDAIEEAGYGDEPAKPKDKKDAKGKDKKDEKSMDDDDVEEAMKDRLKMLEDKVDKLLAKLGDKDAEDKEDKEDKDDEDKPKDKKGKDAKDEDEEEESEDEDKEDKEDKDDEAEDEDEDEESEDDDFEESPAASTNDTASRIEILAPGLKAKGKDAKRLALKTAYKSKDARAVIEQLNGGRPVDFKKVSTKTIDHLFIGASEVLSLYRTKDFAKYKQVKDARARDYASAETMTAEKINEINAKHYANGQGVH